MDLAAWTRPEDTRRGVTFAILSAFGFGTLAIFGRLADAAGLSVVTLLAFRFLLATPLVWLPLAGTGRLQRLEGRILWLALAMGAVGYAAMSFLFLFGVNRTGAGLGGILLYVYPAIVVAIAATVLQEQITRRTVAAVGLALLGVVMVTRGQPTTVDPIGVVAVLLAAVVYSGYITVGRVVLESVDPASLSAYVIPAAALTFVLVGVGSGTVSVPVTPEEWGIVIGVAVVATAVPILSFFVAVSAIGASRTSIVSTFEPVFTVALGALLLDERLTVGTLIGGGAVLAGVLLVQSEQVE
ncbi:MAG: DMT family transporter [Halodesulfurarchaeum sp.]